MTTDKIYLVGFMAAGKTTVAAHLAERLQWRAEDIDMLIETRERRTVADIFARQGELYFRALEREMLKLVMPLRHVVVATGGGTFADPDNRAAIRLDGVTVWLDVPLEHLIARVPSDGRRPLAADREQFEQLFAARQASYAQADVRVACGDAPAADIADRVLDALRTY
ncbi:MAG: shikimate kinase [Acidobacteriota bacterium]|nr:shikimate kinase [Acidobacteriota bacterium]